MNRIEEKKIALPSNLGVRKEKGLPPVKDKGFVFLDESDLGIFPSTPKPEESELVLIEKC